MRTASISSCSGQSTKYSLKATNVSVAAAPVRPRGPALASSSAVQSCQQSGLPTKYAPAAGPKRFAVVLLRSYAPEADYETEEQQSDYFRSGDVVDGVVDGLRPFGAFVKLNGTDTSGLLHISQISSEYIDNMEGVLEVGEQIKVLITRVDRDDGRISLNTKRLERNPGDMINNRQAVWEGAAEMGQAVRDEWAQRRAERHAQREDGESGFRRRDDGSGFRGRGRRDDGESGFRGRGGGGGGRGRGGFRREGGGGGYNREGGERRQRRDFE